MFKEALIFGFHEKNDFLNKIHCRNIPPLKKYMEWLTILYYWSVTNEDNENVKYKEIERWNRQEIFISISSYTYVSLY